jgi:pimeloyl-ACP methyl ester carboxylesterase
MKTTLIFLHGGPGFRDYLKPFFEVLSDRFNCVFFDQVRGPTVKIDEMLSQLNSLVRSIPGNKILIGHSWGAVLATAYVTQYQEQLAGFVLMSTGLSHKHWNDEFQVELTKLGLLDAKPDEIFLTPREAKEGTSFLDQVWESFSNETFESMQTYLDSYDLTDSFRDISIPILNIFGEKDVRFPARICRTFQTLNKRVTNFEIAGAGHFPFLQMEGREKIYKILEHAFLEK